MYKDNGAKEIYETVLIAALTTLATGLINLGLDTYRDWKKKEEDDDE